MKRISIVIPSYNEEENIRAITEEVIKVIETHLTHYDYEIIIIDNDSHDSTQEIIRELCEENKRILAIFNEKNFGPDSSPYYGLLQARGDCAIIISADFQDPPEVIPRLVEKWESGYKVVTAIKSSSKENSIIRLFRTLYYRAMKVVSDIEIIEHFNGFGCYDQSFLQILRDIDDSVPFLRGVVSEFAGNRATIEYEQQKRRAGKSHIRFFTLYDMTMRSVTSYTKAGLRLASFMGYIVALFSFLIALVYFIAKLFYWSEFDFGVPALISGMFFLGGVQLIFLGLLGEYVLTINRRTMHRPLVIERERINFNEEANE